MFEHISRQIWASQDAQLEKWLNVLKGHRKIKLDIKSF